MIANNGGQGVLDGDKWAPTRDTDGNKDYIQVGRGGTTPGKSQTQNQGWPSWADTTGCNQVLQC